MAKRIGYFGGGQYYCKKCKQAHNDLSDIGKKHIKYASKEIQRMAFINYGIR